MDRDDFLKLAPEYYMLALVLHFDFPRDLHGESSFARDFAVNDENDEWHDFVESDTLREEALRRLARLGAIKIIPDPFGPTLWHRGPNFEKLQDEWEKTPSSVFYKARMSGDRREWLMVALPKLNATAKGLNITGADYHAAAVSEFTLDSIAVTDTEAVDEWKPIVIDQADPVVAEAAKQLNAVTEAIEQDNGYSATHPQERDAVVADLKGGLEKMRSGIVSVGWMRRTITALKTVGFRFANTVKGQAAEGALLAIKEMVKTHIGHALEYLWSLFP